MEKIGLFLGETAKFLGDSWWAWLLWAVFFGLCCGSCRLFQNFFAKCLDNEETTLANDPEPPVPGQKIMTGLRGAVAAFKVFGQFYKHVAFVFLCAFVVAVGYLLMNRLTGG